MKKTIVLGVLTVTLVVIMTIAILNNPWFAVTIPPVLFAIAAIIRAINGGRR